MKNKVIFWDRYNRTGFGEGFNYLCNYKGYTLSHGPIDFYGNVYWAVCRKGKQLFRGVSRSDSYIVSDSFETARSAAIKYVDSIEPDQLKLNLGLQEL